MSKSIFELFPGIEIMDSEPCEVRNRFGGSSIVLKPEELAVYDYLTGCEIMGDYEGLRKGIDWFIDNNPEAYMVLLD